MCFFPHFFDGWFGLGVHSSHILKAFRSILLVRLGDSRLTKVRRKASDSVISGFLFRLADLGDLGFGAFFPENMGNFFCFSFFSASFRCIFPSLWEDVQGELWSDRND